MPNDTRKFKMNVSAAELVSLSASINQYLRYTAEQMGEAYIANAQPTSCIDNVKKIKADIERALNGAHVERFEKVR